MTRLVGLRTVLVLSATVSGCGSAEDVAGTSTDPTVTTQAPTSAPTTGAPTTTATSPPTTATAPTTSAITTVSSPTEPSPTTSTSAAPTTTNTPTTSPPTPDVAARPKVGNCYNTGKAAFQRQSDDSEPVSCTSRHTAETFAIFTFESFPNAAKISEVGRTCNAQFKQYVGGSPTISKIGLTVLLPGSKQTAAGQNWIRCDVIELANYNGRGGPPRTGSVSGALDGHVPLEFRGCVKHWPKVDQPVHFTSCQQRHQAELIPESLNLGSPDAKYPGLSSVVTDSKLFCANTVQSYVPEARNYYYYYPKLEGWQSGTRETTCWALNRFGDGLPPI